MFTTSSKLFFGLAAVSVVAGFIYMISSSVEPLGTMLFATGAVAAGFLGTVMLLFRDVEGDLPVALASSAADAEGVHAAGPVASPSVWPMFGGFAAALLAVGIVWDRRVAYGGIVLLVAVVIEWMVKAWSDRASGDPVYNQRLRNRIMHPFEFPIGGVVVAGLVVYGFSRVMLAVPRNWSIALFIGIAALVLTVAFVISAVPQAGKPIGASLAAVGAVVLLAVGIVGASHGERNLKEEARAALSTKSVSDAANPAAVITLKDGQFSPNVVTIPHSVAVNILFKIEDDNGQDQNFAIDLGNGNFASTTPIRGKVEQALSVRITAPGSYKFHSIGTAGAEGTLVVQ